MRRKKKSTTATKSKKAKMGKIAHIKTEVDGILFHSKMESQYYEYLKQLKANGTILDFELQPEFLLQDRFIVVEGIVIYGSEKDFDKTKKKHKALITRAIKYISDFKVWNLDGSISIVDTKGKSTVDFEIKKKMFMARYPEYKLNILIKDKNSGEWVDYYEYKKAERKRKKDNKNK